MDKDICFNKSDLNLYLFLLLCLFVYLVFIVIKQKETMSNNIGSKQELENRIVELNDKLYNCEIKKQICYKDIDQLQSTNNNIQSKFLDKIYNPLSPPENVYSGGRRGNFGYDSYQQYQMIGYLSGSGEQYPVFARDRYPGRSDKQEYYTINDSRNRVKIPFKTKNWNELYDGDIINIPEIGNNLVFKKYDTNQLRYDPNCF